MPSSEMIDASTDESTLSEKLIVCSAAFCLSCHGLVLAAFVLIPLLVAPMTALSVSELIQQAVVVIALFGTPIAAAIWGIDLGAKIVHSRRAS